MKLSFNWMQIVRLIVMVIAVAAVIYAIEYLPSSPLMWISVGLLVLGFLILLFTFRSVQYRRHKGEAESAKPLKKGRR